MMYCGGVATLGTLISMPANYPPVLNKLFGEPSDKALRTLTLSVPLLLATMVKLVYVHFIFTCHSSETCLH